MGKNDRKRGAETSPSSKADRGSSSSSPLARQPIALAALCTIVVALIVAGIVLLAGHQSTPTQISAPATSSTISTIAKDLATVPTAAFNAVAASKGVVTPPASATAPTPLTFPSDSSLPGVLYVGAEYCPFCAAQRWALAVALDRFGSLSGLSTISSSATDVYPNTPTLSFKNAVYSSPYLEFKAVETLTNIPNATKTGYTALQTPSTYEKYLMSKYDSDGSIPFLDIDNMYVAIGASYSPQYLKGLTQLQIAGELSDPTTPAAQAIVSSANDITKALCRATNQQPTKVCSSLSVENATA